MPLAPRKEETSLRTQSKVLGCQDFFMDQLKGSNLVGGPWFASLSTTALPLTIAKNQRWLMEVIEGLAPASFTLSPTPVGPCGPGTSWPGNGCREGLGLPYSVGKVRLPSRAGRTRAWRPATPLLPAFSQPPLLLPKGLRKFQPRPWTGIFPAERKQWGLSWRPEPQRRW